MFYLFFLHLCDRKVSLLNTYRCVLKKGEAWSLCHKQMLCYTEIKHSVWMLQIMQFFYPIRVPSLFMHSIDVLILV